MGLGVRTGQHSMDDIFSKDWIAIAWTCDTNGNGNGSSAHTSTGVALGGSGA